MTGLLRRVLNRLRRNRKPAWAEYVLAETQRMWAESDRREPGP